MNVNITTLYENNPHVLINNNCTYLKKCLIPINCIILWSPSKQKSRFYKIPHSPRVAWQHYPATGEQCPLRWRFYKIPLDICPLFFPTLSSLIVSKTYCDAIMIVVFMLCYDISSDVVLFIGYEFKRRFSSGFICWVLSILCLRCLRFSLRQFI